ncbi:hypothetical protein B0H10DRAFT_2165819 [Mycena sp. CBHHK59/15]|nr:hypothetical protein B0H10DRAFT_2165819 [Mycena sp. CBHHK59/15]
MPPSEGTKKCQYCGRDFALRGYGRHEISCKKKEDDAQANRTFAKKLRAQEQYLDPESDSAQNYDSASRDNINNNTDTNDPEAPPPELDTIKRVFHPHSRRSPTLQGFGEYLASSMPNQAEINDEQPWRPFRTRLDFEFTVANTRELNELWDLASHKCTAFEKDVITVQYKEEEKTYNTYTRPLWDWVLSLVQDPRLASCFVWDAEKAYRFNGESYVRFYHEPWTADAFWAVQSALPDDPAAKPLCLIVYADKSKLSTFGTEKGYAVIARVANIPVAIRNSNQFGGGHVVGHQPIVKDDPQENNKPAFANFKNVVWHTAFYKLLESIVQISKVGNWTTCGDEILRWLWPLILILAADYEEACVMALIRGLQGLYPCPMCFVPWNEQSDLSQATEHPLRTGAQSERILKVARTKRTVAEREEMLKDNGLRDVENVFWKIHNTDPHRALLFDRLHAYHGGLWGDHIFPQIKARVTEQGRSSIVKIDTQMAALPRWRGLNHFETVMNTSFNDGSKHEDIAKMMLFVAHNVLLDDAGILLLQCLRSYLELDMYVALQIHTSETIAAGRRELLIFDSLMKVRCGWSFQSTSINFFCLLQKYIEACEGTVHAEKSWNFPKMHSHAHVFDDIEQKGASRNFGTKINESMHGPIRQTYQKLTNFKNVTPQLLKHDHRRTVALYIREQLDELDAPSEEETQLEESTPELETMVSSNIDIGAKLKPVAFSAIEEMMSQDLAFERFRVRFGDFLSNFLPAYGHRLPNGKRIRFDGTEMIVPFQFLKVHFESMGDWTYTADYLRCNPNFHGQARYDAALVKTTDKPIIVQLIYMFSCTVEGKSHPFALVLPLDARTGSLGRKDKALRLYRVHAKPRRNTEFISVHSIIRGVLLAPDFEKPGEFLVIDIVDTDISLRLKSMYPDRYTS